MKLQNLKSVETFIYYDGPLFFSARDQDGDLYLLADISDPHTDNCRANYMAVAVTDEQIEKLKANQLPMREPFLQADERWRLTFKGTATDTIAPIPLAEILADPDAFVAREGVMLTDDAYAK